MASKRSYDVENNWHEKINTGIAVVALLISVVTGYYQLNEKNEFSKGADQVMINSIDIELRDLDLMYDSIFNNNNQLVTKTELNSYLKGMRENYKILSGITATNFPKNQTLDYQTMRIDMKMDIDDMQTLVNSIKKKPKSDEINISKNYKKEVLQLILETRKGEKWNQDVLESGQPLTQKQNEYNDKQFEKRYNKQIKYNQQHSLNIQWSDKQK